MEKRVRMVLTVTALLLCGMLLYALMQRPPEPVRVQTAVAGVQDIYNSVTAPGTVEAVNSTSVCPLETSIVTERYVEAGDMVEEGSLLCTLSPATMDAAGSGNLQTVFKAISQPAGKVVTSDTPSVLRAPCDGEVLEMPEEGSMVWKGLPCIRIADLKCLQVRVKTPELYAGELEVGQPANVTASASGDKRYAAIVKSIAPAAVRTSSLTGDTGSATVEAVLPISGDVSGLKPGYTASAKIFTQHHTDAVVVPFEAVCQRGDTEYVFCVENSRAILREVVTGYLLENVTEIEQGLNGGETVVIAPADTLSDGTLVEVVGK